MGPLIALLVIVAVSLLVVRVAAMALMMTGLSRDTASFQAYSAFFGVGFTTTEAEHVVNHPVRRRIIRDLILLGNIGLSSGLATIIITFINARESLAQVFLSLACLAVGALLFYLLGRIGVLQKMMDISIRKALEKSRALRIADYETLLRVQSGYCVSEIDILPNNPFAGRKLGESRPADSGVLVLGITRDKEFIGAPDREEVVEIGDVLLVYGLAKDIKPYSIGEGAAST